MFDKRLKEFFNYLYSIIVMMIALIILFHLFVIIKSLKICSNCKYFIPGDSFSPQLFYAKCAAFPSLKYLVAGPTENEQHIYHIDDYHYCSTSRNLESLCGKEGKKYRKKYKRKKLDRLD